MLSASANISSGIRTVYAGFEIASDANVIEIEADLLSVSALKSAIDKAAETTADDLIILRTTADTHAVEFSNQEDELIINVNADDFGLITIVADGDEALTIDANYFSRILTVQSGSSVQLGNLVFTGGFTRMNLEGEESTCAVGGGIVNAGTLALVNVTVTDCAAKGIFSNSYFGFCSKGGGIYNTGDLFVGNSTIGGNTAHSAAASSNEWAAYGGGGGIFNDVLGSLTLQSTTIDNNTAESKTLILVIGDVGGQTVEVDQYGCGGGLYNIGSAVISADSCFLNNFAYQGGAVFTLAKTESSSLWLDQTELKNNRAKEFGGAIYSDEGSETTLTRCLVEGNQSGQNGGGIYSVSALSVSNTVFTGNTAEDDGGAIYATAFAGNVYDVLLTNITVTGNSAKIAGGGIALIDTSVQKTLITMTLNNSILVNNSVLAPADAGEDPNILANGVLNGSATLSTFSAWSDNDGDCFLFDSAIPLFLRDYDFATNTIGDYRLAFSDISQAIDQGNNALSGSEFDEAGKPRLSGASVDLGAYEAQFGGDTAAIAEDSYTVQAGCSVYLSAEEMIDGFIYLWDLDGDGIYEEHDSGFWASVDDLNGSRIVKMRAIDQNGDISQSVTASLSFETVAPTLLVRTTEYADGQ